MMVAPEHRWPGRFHQPLDISTWQYARLVRDWVSFIGLEPGSYETHSMCRTKVAQLLDRDMRYKAPRTDSDADTLVIYRLEAPHTPIAGHASGAHIRVKREAYISPYQDSAIICDIRRQASAFAGNAHDIRRVRPRCSV